MEKIWVNKEADKIILYLFIFQRMGLLIFIILIIVYNV